MNDHIQSVEYYDVLSSEDRNRVLRNTYWLLAVSMLPTVLGAWVGVASGISYALSGGLGIILMLAGALLVWKTGRDNMAPRSQSSREMRQGLRP